jgi:hypothetical protein
MMEEPTPSSPLEHPPMDVDDINSNNNEEENSDGKLSALRENIRRKGKNAYYFAHENTPQGPAWDGKPEPKRLEDAGDGNSSVHVRLERKQSSFDIYKSNITKYAFADGDKSVKLYIDIQETLTPEDVSLEFTEESLSLVLDPPGETQEEQDQKKQQQPQNPRTLYFTKLAGKITKATFKIKPEDKLLVLILKKQLPGENWHTINNKGCPDHEVV